MALLADAHNPTATPMRATRAPARVPTAAQLMAAIGAVLSGGMLTAILTTSDLLWWQFAFSAMGTSRDFSGHVFNATILVASTLLVLFGVRLRVEMKLHAGTPVLANRHAAIIVPLLLASMGLHLSLVGLFPLNVNKSLHELGPVGALLSFAVIIGASRWLLKGMHRAVARGTRRAAIVLVVSIPPYIAGFINMTLFELIVFAVMVSWLLLVARNLGHTAEAPAGIPDALAVPHPRVEFVLVTHPVLPARSMRAHQRKLAPSSHRPIRRMIRRNSRRSQRSRMT